VEYLKYRTREIARLLEQNKVLEKIVFREHEYERKAWDAHVAPRLELNFYGKWFPTLRSGAVRSGSHAALLGAAFGRVRNERTDVLWLLVSQNQGTILGRLPQVEP
jgi:hypothetical protein